jgi:hypothetical protein
MLQRHYWIAVLAGFLLVVLAVVSYGCGNSAGATSTKEVNPPIGTIMGWAKDLDSAVPALPEDWAECDGGIVSDPESPLNGVRLPDLNGNRMVLIGNSSSGSSWELQTGPVGTPAHSHLLSYFSASPPPPDRPVQYDVVWIIRIK